MSWLYIPRPPYEQKPEAVNYISVCSGGGGLDVGVSLAVPGARCVCYLEREAPAVAALVAGMEARVLDDAPVWSDASTFDSRRWRGRVAGVVGGTPCQDLSLAGKRAGLGGSRSGLFFEFVRIVREVEPDWLLWENVGGAASALSAVFAAFESAGYRGAHTRLRARDVGATHERARVFVLAHRDLDGLQRQRRIEGRPGVGVEVADADGRGGPLPSVDGGAVAHGAGLGWGEGRAQPAGLGGGPHATERGGAVGDGDGPGLEGRGVCGRERADEQAPGAGGGDGLPLWPPGPADVVGWRAVLQRWPHLAPALPQPSLRGVVDGMEVVAGGLERIDLLRLLGNGVVPEQAAAAIRLMSNRLFERDYP